jgi:hypothetical protein
MKRTNKEYKKGVQKGENVASFLVHLKEFEPNNGITIKQVHPLTNPLLVRFFIHPLIGF